MSEQQTQRDREIQRAHAKMPSPFSAKVVGVSFVDTYPRNLYALAEMTNRAGVGGPGGDMTELHARQDRGGERPAVVLRRNPDNEYDTNAIEVHVPSLGDLGFIGHLTRPIATRMAPEMDDGIKWLAHVESVLIDPDHEDRPGISIRCERHTDD